MDNGRDRFISLRNVTNASKSGVLAYLLEKKLSRVCVYTRVCTYRAHTHTHTLDSNPRNMLDSSRPCTNFQVGEERELEKKLMDIRGTFVIQSFLR